MPRRVKWKRNNRRYKKLLSILRRLHFVFETLTSYTNKKYKKLKNSAYFSYSVHGFTDLHAHVLLLAALLLLEANAEGAADSVAQPLAAARRGAACS